MQVLAAFRGAGTILVAVAVVGATLLSAQQQTPTFRSEVTHVTTDVIPRDASGRFVPDLGKADFTII